MGPRRVYAHFSEVKMDSAVSVMETTVQLVASIIKVKGTAVLAAFIEVRDAEIMQLIGEQNGKLAVKPA